jgi:hypothetical protein
MAAAKRFLRELESYGLLDTPRPVDDHRYTLRVPKEWDYAAWLAMYDRFGPPPWRGQHDGLIPEDRWEACYGPRPRPRVRNRKR